MIVWQHCITNRLTNPKLLTHSTQLPSSKPPWPLLGSLQALLRSSRRFCLWHGTRSQSYTELLPVPPTVTQIHDQHINAKILDSVVGTRCLPTLSLMSLAMSKCLWQQTTASSNRPSTFNVFPRFPLALASPTRSPIVLQKVHYVNKKIMFYEQSKVWRFRSC